jgi:glycosyltransferase involved in cell wall biosynthesis
MPEHRAYLEQVRAAAVGYPIYLHVDAPFAELRRLTATAQIFWHATGYGEDEEQTPERMEHFGITTVEAMAAGCVPVVIARGGQVEIVEQYVSGLLWQTLPELQALTRALIEDPQLCARLAAGARQRSQFFGMQHFRANLLALIESLRR